MTPAEAHDLFRQNPHTNVWGYLRVSSEKQTKDGEGLGSQRHAILEFCKAKGLSPPVFVEEVASASKQMFVPNLKKGEATDEGNVRPVFMALLGHLTNRPNSVLVVFGLDRIARTMIDQELILNLLWKNDVRVYSTRAGEESILDGNKLDPDRVLYRMILAAFKQYEAKAIQARMWSGIVRKGATGGFTGGRPPMGYVVKDGELVIDPYEAQMVRYIYFLKIKHSLSIRSIQAKIAEGQSPEDSRVYTTSVIQRVLKRDALYRGGQYKDFLGSIHSRPDLIILPKTLAELEALVFSPEYKPVKEAARGQ